MSFYSSNLLKDISKDDLDIPMLLELEPFFKALSPWFVTGFIDGFGCFTASINTNKTSRFGYAIRLAVPFKWKLILETLNY